jgi:glucosamine kinase
MADIVIGVDGGGTRTRVLMLDLEGNEVGRGEGTATLVTPDTPPQTALLIDTIVRRVMNEHRIPRPAGALWAGIAGAGRETTRERLQAELEEVSRNAVQRVGVGTDVDAAIHDAFRGGPGIVLIAGTGSIALAIKSSGERVKVGGWGETLGDEGSGHWLAIQALRAVLQGHDGRGASTALRQLPDQMGVDSPSALVDWVSRASKRDVASLAPSVIEIAEQGDEVAQRLVSGAVVALRAHLEALVERVGSEAGTTLRAVALVGGLVQPGRPLRQEIEDIIVELGLEVLDRAVFPERGAALLALDMVTRDT